MCMTYNKYDKHWLITLIHDDINVLSTKKDRSQAWQLNWKLIQRDKHMEQHTLQSQ